MAKKFCPEGQRHNANLADAERKVREEARRLSKFKRADIDTSTLIKLKELVKSSKKTYARHADSCDTCS